MDRVVHMILALATLDLLTAPFAQNTHQPKHLQHYCITRESNPQVGEGSSSSNVASAPLQVRSLEGITT